MANENENYKLNQSGPQVQALLDKIAALPNNEQLAALLDAKQNVLIFDETPTEGSTNPVTSDGILAAIQAILSNEYVRVDTYADLGDPSQESMGKVYLVGLENAESFDRYVAGKSGDTYIWVSLGSTELDLSQYYTKEQTEALLEQELQEAIEPLARKDGYYETLTAGMAENLVGQSENTDTFTTETTGGDSDFGNGLAELATVEGNGLAWNQKWTDELTLYRDTEGQSITKNGTSDYTINTGSAVDGLTQGVKINNPAIPAGRKMLVHFENDIPIKVYGEPFGSLDYPAGKNKLILEARSYPAWDTSVIFRPQSALATNTDYHLKNLYITDLSLIYGLVNEPTTVEQFEADLAKLIAQKPYYQQNAGELYGVKKLHIVSYGQNLLNPTNAQARLAPYDWDTNSNKYGIAFRNGASASAIQFTPDATGVAETITPDSNGIFTISGTGTLQLTMASGSAASDAYVWAVWDGKKNGIENYKPYSADALEIVVGNIYGKLNGAGDMVKVFSDDVMRATGIKSTDVHDVIDLQSITADVNVGSVNLGELTWEYDSRYTFFRCGSMLDEIKNQLDTTIPYNGVTTKYISSTWGNRGDLKTVFGYFIGAGLYIFDYSKTDADLVDGYASWLNGVPLWYELATQKHYTDLKLSSDGGETFQDLPERFSVDNWGVWEQLPNDSTIPSGKDFTGVAAQITTILPMNAPEAIDTFLQQGITTTEERAQVVNILAALKAQNIIGDYSVGDTPTNKVFSVSVTPYVEPEPEP